MKALRILVMILAVPLCLGAICSQGQQKCAKVMPDTTNDAQAEWELLQQAEAELGEYATDSEAAWIDGYDKYVEKRKCDGW